MTEMTKVVVAGTSGRFVHAEFGLFPEDFIFGEQDPRAADLRNTSKKILDEKA